MRKRYLTIVFIFLMLIQGTGFAQAFQYIGAAKCKNCHDKESTGDQYKKWKETTHARAWKVLGSAKGLEVGMQQGITNPQKDERCLKCHSTAAAAEKNQIATITIEEGVSCETCHGPGSKYKSQAIMKDHNLSLKNGLKKPDEKNCLKCHNQESPTYKPFNLSEYTEKIAHNIPR